uniref:RLF zinc finger n=1 Tax=Leptobrachium leishanense TaxID=445787 RepID=A0A8C5MI00_9ANUR
MADGKGESRAGLANGGTPPPPSSRSQYHSFVETLRALEDRLKDHEVSVHASAMYCESFCEESHEILVEFGNYNMQLLVDVIKNGSAWKNHVLVKILSQQFVQEEEVEKWISQEGSCFLQMRVKHLMKSNCIQQAMILSKLCSESANFLNDSFFRQSFITCLCTMLPDEEAFKEISKMEGKEVLDTICNLESEGQDNTAFILCTTYLTQQLQNEITSCSWELTLFWSKLQRGIDSSLNTFLERCRQFGLIAKTLQHLFFLIKVVHTEAGDAGVPVSIMLCIQALQIQSSETDATKISVCKTIACLLPLDLEVRRACQLTEFLFEPSMEGLNILEELFLQPDQKNEEETSVISNSLRCELLLALKSHWVFDPEFWDWKTLKRHCLKILGKEVSDTEEEEYGETSANEPDLLTSTLASYEENAEQTQELAEIPNEIENVKVKKPVGSSERYKRWLQYKFYCVICKREVIEARILHHAKMHLNDGIYTCPVCIKKFRKKDVFVTHVMEHMKMPMRHKPRKKNEQNVLKDVDDVVNVESDNEDGYMTFKLLQDKNLQDRDVYPCPGTGCNRVFKQFKYLSIHLKAEHPNNDENAKHYLDMKNMREKCTFCRRHFITSFHVNRHIKIHIDPEPFMCISLDCNETFKTINELLLHKQKHLELQYKCELKGCNLVFSDLGLLYHHEAQHFRDASYGCSFPGCKKFYYCIPDIRNHIASHGIQTTGSRHNGTAVFKEIKTENPLSPCSLGPMHPVKIENVCFDSPTYKDMQMVSGEVNGRLMDFNSVPHNHSEHLPKLEPCLHHGSGLECTCENANKGLVSFQGLRPSQFTNSDNPSGAEEDSKTSICTNSQLLSIQGKGVKNMGSDACGTGSDKVNAKEECTDFPVPSAFHRPSASEDTLCELLTSLKHLNLKNSNTCIVYSGQQGQAARASSSSCGPTSQIPPHQKEQMLSQYHARLTCKPYICELQGCKYTFVTKEALLLHYIKKHHYTKEKALKFQMLQNTFSPFECHICQRSFTRRTLLRIHYRNKHHLTKEKICRPGRGKLDNPMQSCVTNAGYTNSLHPFHPNETSRSTFIRESPIQEEFNSEIYADSLSDETDTSHGVDSGSHGDDYEAVKGRGSRRVVAQGNLCYILNKYHKPFPCIHKNCAASFTTQRGLVRHYKLVHQYSKESLCLEKEKSNKEDGKCRRIFTCKYKECSKSFICARALSKHYKEFHDHGENEDQELEMFYAENHLKAPTYDEAEKLSEETESDECEICCDVEGCSAVFTNHLTYSRHVLSRHRKFKLLEGKRKRGRPPLRRTLEKRNQPKHERRVLYRGKKVRVKPKVMQKEIVEFKTNEQVLRMCTLNVRTPQFPCVLRGCNSVVKLESSMIRHYKLTHHLSPAYITSHHSELVYPVKSCRGNKEESLSGDVIKRDCVSESKIPKLHFHGDVHSTFDQSDGYESPKKRYLEGKDTVNYNTSSNHNKYSESCLAKLQSPIRKPESVFSKASEKENLSFTHFEAACRGDGSHVNSPLDSSEGQQKELDFKAFKPMGFESSFLKFLQESKETDDELDETPDQYNHPHSFQNQMPYKNRKRSESGLSQGSRVGQENLEGFRPLLSSSAQSAASALTLQNLRTILDKALTDCGDLALKQLHYQRPVVVLERSKFTAPLIDLFSNKKNDELFVGFS